jgi:hypothetical protein
MGDPSEEIKRRKAEMNVAVPPSEGQSKSLFTVALPTDRTEILTALVQKN